MSMSTSEQDRIEHDLERTRARMDNRLNELQDRLSPGQVLDDLMAYFRGSEGGDFARNLMASVRNNPLPAALTGIGLTWLMASNPHPVPASSSHSELNDGNGLASKSLETSAKLTQGPSGDAWASAEALENAMRHAEAGVVRSIGELDGVYQGRITEARGMVLGVARETEDTQDTFAKRVQDAVATAMQSASEFTSDLGNRASEISKSVGRTLQDAGTQVAQSAQAAQQISTSLLSTITGNPVLLGAVGLAVGALLGALVPQAEGEEASLAGIADQARETATDLAQTVVDHSGQVAGRVLDAGSDSARALGLTADTSIGSLVDGALSGKLVGDVKKVAQDVLQAGDEAVRK